jgi:hypothetical protein
MFPHVGRELRLGEGAFDTRGHRYALLLQGRSTLWVRSSTPRGPVRTAERGAAMPRTPPLAEGGRICHRACPSPAPARSRCALAAVPARQ